MIIVTVNEIQNDFDRYLALIMNGQEIVITNNGQELGRFVPKNPTVSYLTDSLTGILKEDYTPDNANLESLKEKYNFAD